MWIVEGYYGVLFVLLRLLEGKRRKINKICAVWSIDCTALFCSTKIERNKLYFLFLSNNSQNCKRIRAPPFSLNFKLKIQTERRIQNASILY